MRPAVLLALVTACRAPQGRTDPSEPGGAGAHAAPEPAPTPEPTPAPGPAPGPEPAPTYEPAPEPGAWLTLQLEQMLSGQDGELWVVAGGACNSLAFRPRDPDTGSLLFNAVRIHYERREGLLVLGAASISVGAGTVGKPCRTWLEVGTMDGRLGGATLFADRAACEAGQATAAALDDTAAATAAKCRGAALAIGTDEVECGVGHRYAIVAGKPGCINVALTILGPWPRR